MRLDWELEDLIACWTLDEADWRLLANKTGATRLGFALLLKFFDLEGRFPTDRAELPAAAVDYVAGLVKVPAVELPDTPGRGARSSLTARRSVPSARSGRRPVMTSRGWSNGLPASCARWSSHRIVCVTICSRACAGRGSSRPDPPGSSGSSQRRSLFERRFTERLVERLPASAIDRLEQLVTASQDGFLAELKSDPGRPGLNTILEEIAKLERVRALELPADPRVPRFVGSFGPVWG